MNVMLINSVPYGSTGTILFSLSDLLRQEGHQTLCTTGFSWHTPPRTDWFQTSGIVEKQLHTLLARATGFNGCFSVLATRRLIRKIAAFQPDILHLHNLHGWYLNLPMFFSYLKQAGIPVVWTLHDCWAFTGQCPHFAMVGCEKWRTECHACPQTRRYPQTCVDRSRQMYHLKRRWFREVPELTLVTPSFWLAELVSHSFLREYPVQVIPNGIDLDVFSPRSGSFRRERGLEGCHMILAVSLGWDNSKGLDVILALARRLEEPYRIVLVGVEEPLASRLPSNVIPLPRTHDRAALAELYTAADLFLNPTREDTYPTVNMEALACGTPVVTFSTGGSSEMLDPSCGSVVAWDHMDALEQEVRRICTTRPFSPEACLEKAKTFSRDIRFRDYLNLYRSIYDRTATKRI